MKEGYKPRCYKPRCRIIDVSQYLEEGMPTYPGDPSFSMVRVSKIEAGDRANVSLLTMGAHSGTHVDAPLHFLEEGRSVDEIPLDRLVGEAVVVELLRRRVKVTAGDLRPYEAKLRDKIVLIKTRNSQRWGEKEFPRRYVYLSKGAAEWLVRSRVKSVGFDWLSIEKYGDERAAAHEALLGNGIPVIEGLNLSRVKEGNYFFACLPLKIRGCEGAPARALLIKGD